MRVSLKNRISNAAADGTVSRTEAQQIRDAVVGNKKVSSREVTTLRKALKDHSAKFGTEDRQWIETTVGNKLKTNLAKDRFLKQLGYTRGARVGGSYFDKDGVTLRTVGAHEFTNSRGEKLYKSDMGTFSTSKSFRPYDPPPRILTPNGGLWLPSGRVWTP
jgi:hypothetical protein